MLPALFASLMAVVQPQTVESVTIAEWPCHAMVQRGNEVETSLVPDLRVIERTAADGPFVAPELPPGTSAIMCLRSDIVPAPNDWKVLDAGYPLYIIERGEPPESRRAGVLEVLEGRFQFRFLRGEMVQGEEARLQARLNQLQEGGRRSPPPIAD